MLYTIVPYEQLFRDIDAIDSPRELVYLGQRVLATPLPEPGEFRLVQLLSTDPQLFLHPDFQPGRVIRYPAFQSSTR